MSTKLCFLFLLCILSSGEEFTDYFVSNGKGYNGVTTNRYLYANISIPDMFLKKKRRRLKESSLPPGYQLTPSPTVYVGPKRLLLPVVVLIHPEGPQNRYLSLYGSRFNMNRSYYGEIFNDLKESLYNNGNMVVITYDKRTCQEANSSMFANNYTGPYPFCTTTCPRFCNVEQENEKQHNYECQWFLPENCYDSTQVTINEILRDAYVILTNGTQIVQKKIDHNIVEKIWLIPIGYSAQGVSIANYLATTKQMKYDYKRTAISLMGSGVNIYDLLYIQLKKLLESNHDHLNGYGNDTYIYHRLKGLNDTIECIKNGSFLDNDIVSDIEYIDLPGIRYTAAFWREWYELYNSTDYSNLEYFLSINSFADDIIGYDAFIKLHETYIRNATVENHILQDINHYLIRKDYWNNGEWIVDGSISNLIINYLNDMSGYLDDINEYIVNNSGSEDNSNIHVITESEEDIYKILLYISILMIILILACGIYFIFAKKMCPYEFEDIAINLNNNNVENDERERQRRRRHRRRRHRRNRNESSSSNRSRRSRNITRLVELQEPMVQHNNNNNDDDDNNINDDNVIENNPIDQSNNPLVPENLQLQT